MRLASIDGTILGIRTVTPSHGSGFTTLADIAWKARHLDDGRGLGVHTELPLSWNAAPPKILTPENTAVRLELHSTTPVPRVVYTLADGSFLVIPEDTPTMRYSGGTVSIGRGEAEQGIQAEHLAARLEAVVRELRGGR